MFVARCRINFCNSRKWRILSDFCSKTAQNRGAFSARCPFKSNKRSHSGDDGFRVHLFHRRRKCRFAEMLVASHFRLKVLRLLFRAKATVLREGCGKINGNFENSKLRFEQGALCAPCNFAPLPLLFPQKLLFAGALCKLAI